MCLSDAYELVGGERKPLMNYVSAISVEDGVVTLTDMLGARKLVPGTLKSVDLTSNVILIEPRESAQMMEPRFIFRLTSYQHRQAAAPGQSRAGAAQRDSLPVQSTPFLWKRKDKLKAKGKERPAHPSKSGAYDKAAGKLLKGKDELRAKDDIRILFYDEGMKTHASYIPFTEFYGAIETRDTIMLIYGPLVTLCKSTTCWREI